MIIRFTGVIAILALFLSTILFANEQEVKVKKIQPPIKNQQIKKSVKQIHQIKRPVRKYKQVIIPDIELRILGIIGNDSKRIANIEFEGKSSDYFVGDIKVGGFKVIAIGKNYVSVYSFRKRRQRTFKL
ncbi:hypothetical protein KAJ27_17565 [bacterium]|nr:hypothetical protein [bacterium]